MKHEREMRKSIAARVAGTFLVVPVCVTGAEAAIEAQQTAAAGAEAMSHESVWEATCCAHAAPWLSVQPNIQYVINPGADAQIKNATVLGIRFEMSGEK